MPYLKTAEPTIAAIARDLGLRADGVKGKLPQNVKLLSASAAGVLIVKAAGRHFALRFGQGRHLLKPGAWERIRDRLPPSAHFGYFGAHFKFKIRTPDLDRNLKTV